MASTVSEFTEVFEPQLAEEPKSMVLQWTNEVIDMVIYQVGIDLSGMTVGRLHELKEISEKLKKKILA